MSATGGCLCGGVRYEVLGALRDVVIFQHTRFGSTKRALLVVTGKVLAGIDLQKGMDVKIDHGARKITIILPPRGSTWTTVPERVVTQTLPPHTVTAVGWANGE